ncbi:MAG: hypothetical protein KIT80_05615 [Chitinophagaceae bacterium]|nr:hypothetical protein [Chitinophagaceae bacterium]MCW5926374.1 hypothetical protein [Chitinophagaceae bacterium]
MKEKLASILFVILFATVYPGCGKQGYITHPGATISVTDSIRFDTIFTSIGSVTRFFTIINTNNQKLKLNTVRLMGGSQSPYKINIDGIPGEAVHNIDLDAGDSLYVFVSVTIDPGSALTPFLIKDSIEISYNGNQHYTQLEAYGQNAHFLSNHAITTDTQWEDDLPYVISGGLYIAENAMLTLEKGCRIFLHANAPVLVDGSLRINGTPEEKVYFQGDRLDRGYRDLPASWPGIILNEQSHSNIFTNTVIKNAYQAIIAVGPSPNAQPKLQLYQCVLDNIYDTGIQALASEINAVNCLISNCGANIHLAAGGSYTFTHCTISSFNNIYFSHTRPLVYISDSYEQVTGNSLYVLFRNSIIWGGDGAVENELVTERKGNTVFDIRLEHTLYGNQKEIPTAELINSIANKDPLFDSINATRRHFDFRLKNNSPAIGAGMDAGISIDLDNKPRSGTPDLGCYENP